MSSLNTRMRLTVEVLPLTAENAHGPSRAQAIAEFKARRFALPVQLEHTFEHVSSMIAQRYVQNYLRPEQVTSFSIHKLQDAYDCDLDLRDTVSSIFEGENDPAMRMIKVVPGFHDRDFSLPPTSNLVPSLTQKRLRETRPEQSQKRRKIETDRAQLIQRDEPIPTTESDNSRNGSVADGIVNGAPVRPRTSRSQTGASMVVTNDAHTGRAEFASVKEESVGSESPSREHFKKPLAPASHEKNRKNAKHMERIRESPALQRAGEDSEVYDTASEDIQEQVQPEQVHVAHANATSVPGHSLSPQVVIPAHSPPTSDFSAAPTRAKNYAAKRKAQEDVFNISNLSASPEAEIRHETPKPKQTPVSKRAVAAKATPKANATPKPSATPRAGSTSASTATPGSNPAPKRRGRPPGAKDKHPRKSTLARIDRDHKEVSLLNNARVQPESPAPSAQSATPVSITKKANDFHVPKKDEIVSSQESDLTGSFLQSVAPASSQPTINTPSGKTRAGALKKPSKELLHSPARPSPAAKPGRAVQFISPKSSPLNASQVRNGPRIVSTPQDEDLRAQLERAASSQSASPVLVRHASPPSQAARLPAASTPHPKAAKQTPIPLPDNIPITPSQNNIAIKSVTPEVNQSYKNLAPGPMKDPIDRRSSGSSAGGKPRKLRQSLGVHSSSQALETPLVHESVRRLSNSNAEIRPQRQTPVPLPPNMRTEHSVSNGDVVKSTPEPTPKPQTKAKASPLPNPSSSSINTAIKPTINSQKSPIENGTVALQEPVQAKQPVASQKKANTPVAPKPHVKAVPVPPKRMTRVEAMKHGSPEDPISISSASPDTSPAPSSSSDEVQEIAPPSSQKAKPSVSQRSQEEDIQDMLASQDRAAPRSSNVSEYRSDPAEEDAISDDEAELEATINERSASAVSSRSSPTMARKPARFLSHSPTPKDQSESESESDSMDGANGAALPQVGGKDNEDSETDTSTSSDEPDSDQKDTPMPNAPPSTNGNVAPSTSQPTVSTIHPRKTAVPPPSTAPAAVRHPVAPRTRPSAHRYPSLTKQVAESRNGPLIKPQGKKGPDVRQLNFSKLGKGTKGGTLSQEFIVESDDDESSSSSSGDDE